MTLLSNSLTYLYNISPSAVIGHGFGRQGKVVNGIKKLVTQATFILFQFKVYKNFSDKIL